MSTQEIATEEHSQFNNENLSVSVAKLPNCFVKFDIKVSPKGTEAAYQKALRAINKEVVIPGFRKGRAPDHMIKEKYAGAIQKEFIDTVLQTGFNESIHLTNVHPLKDGQVKRPVVHACDREKGASFTLEFETRPHVPSVKLDELHLNKKSTPTEIPEKDKENALHNLILQFTTYEPILDQPVKEDNFVDIDVEILSDPPRQVVDNHRTQVNSKGLPFWMRDKVIGLQAGESAEGMTDQDPALSTPDPDFQPSPFRVTVKKIWRGIPPQINDELAVKVGLKTVDELHQKINKRLQHEIQEDIYKENIQRLEDFLVEKYPFDIPQTYIEANTETRLNSYLDQLSRQGANYEEKEIHAIEKMIEKSVKRNLQLFFLLQKVAMEHKITLSADDLSQEFTHQFALMSSGKSQLDLAGGKDQLREQLHHSAMDRKIKQFLLNHAQTVE